MGLVRLRLYVKMVGGWGGWLSCPTFVWSSNSHALNPTPTHTYTTGGRNRLAVMARPPEPHAYRPLRADADHAADDATSSIALDQGTLGMHDPHDSISATQASRASACYQGQLYKKRERCLGFCKPHWQSR